MTPDEGRRHELRQRLDDVLGPGPAATLMEHLHPQPWTELATRTDLDQLAQRLEQRIDGARHQVTADLLRELNAQTRVLFFGMVGAVFTTACLAFAAAQIG